MSERQKALEDVLAEIKSIRCVGHQTKEEHNFHVGVDVVRRAVERLIKKDQEPTMSQTNRIHG